MYLLDDIKKYRKELKEWYKKEKSTKDCIICHKRIYLQYHHVDPSTKIMSVAQMVHKAFPKEDIIAEMNKCVILCRKCHCKEHNKMKREKNQGT